MKSERGMPLLIVLSGPSGAGKDAILDRLKESGSLFHYTVTVTTRPRRIGERDGVEYHFISDDSFWQMVEGGELLEWAKVYGCYYGVPKGEVKQALAKGQDVVVKVDVQGAATLKGLLPQAVFIFLVPPTLEELAHRLRLRQSEGNESLKLRLETAPEEMKWMSMFDYIVVNYQGRADLAVSQIEAIVTAERCRAIPRLVEL